MIEKLKWTGWVITSILFLIISLQRSCIGKKNAESYITNDTVEIRGDNQLITVQDTVFAPVKTVYISKQTKIDTNAVLKDYFAERTYLDTIKSRDVIAVVKDSIKDNKLAGCKILIENTRDKQFIETHNGQTNNLFLGGFIGLSHLSLRPSAGISISLVNKKDVMYTYNFDAFSQTHSVGISLKLFLNLVNQF